MQRCSQESTGKALLDRPQAPLHGAHRPRRGFRAASATPCASGPTSSARDAAGDEVTALTATACGITTRPAPAQQPQRREEGVRLLRLLEEHTTGLVMAVDDIHATDREEITRPAADVQHCVRAGLPTGLVLAGPPAAVPDQLDEGVATFLRRADRIGPHAASAGDVQPSAPRVRETPSRPRSAQKRLPSCDVLRSGAPGGPGGLAPAGGERLGHRRAAATRPGRCRLGRPP